MRLAGHMFTWLGTCSASSSLTTALAAANGIGGRIAHRLIRFGGQFLGAPSRRSFGHFALQNWPNIAPVPLLPLAIGRLDRVALPPKHWLSE
jgi:hypothetical protein